MMDDGKNKGPGEFDETFDDDFSDADFDETAYDDDADYSEFSGEEGEYEGDDFETDEWGDEEQAPTTDKKAKKHKKGGGLSFNAMVIIGAVVLGGGVMAFNIMKETGKKTASQQSTFRSILNIGGIMDGTLFGQSGDDPAQEEQQAQLDGGFLNNPSTALDGSTPPQPAPMAPAEQDAGMDPLTPMPEMAAPPRGPDEVPPTEFTLADDQTPSAASTVRTPVPSDEQAANNDLAAAPETTQAEPAPEQSSSSAEDLLKQAMATREQKRQQDEASTEADDAPDAVVAPAPLETTPAPAQQDIVVLPDSALAPALSEQDKQALAESQRAVTALESKIDALLERMNRIEGDLGALKEGVPATQDSGLEEAVAALRKDIAEIKARPASSAPAPRRPEPAPKKAETAPAAKPATSAQASPKPAATTQPRQQQARWELRAAQPGRAWVSRSGERDMQAVSVGDTLTGVGRITAITYQNGRWAVIGTQGTIQQ